MQPNRPPAHFEGVTVPDLAADLRAQLARAAAGATPAPTAPPTAPPADRTARAAADADRDRRAREAQARSFAQSVFFFGGVGAASAALRSQAPRTAGAALTFSTGFEFAREATALRASGAGVSRAVRPGPFALLLFSPQPVGLIPPEQLGLRPDYLDVRIVPRALQFETLNTAADADRLSAFLASNARAAFEAELVALRSLPLSQLREQIQAIEALPQEARVIGAPLQTYYATALEILRRRERLSGETNTASEQTSSSTALFVSRDQLARIEAGELIAVPVAPLAGAQTPGGAPVPLLGADQLPAVGAPAIGAPSLLDLVPGDDVGLLPALFPSLLRPTDSGFRTNEPNLLEGQSEHFTERVDP